MPSFFNKYIVDCFGYVYEWVKCLLPEFVLIAIDIVF